MDAKKDALALAAMCGIALLLSLGGIAWIFTSGIGFTLDAIFMLLVCLTMAGLFAGMLLWQLKSLRPPKKDGE